MTLRTSVGVWRATFFATLGMAPLMACSSSTSSDVGKPSDAGAGGSAAGATGSSGGVTAAGGSHAGGTTASGGGGAGGITAAGGKTQTDSGAGGSDAGPTACKNPQPQIGSDGKATGFVNCDGGWGHRVEQKTCPSTLPRAGVTCGTGPVGDAAIASGECYQDSDCKGAPNGYCAPGGLAIPGCFCNYGCTTDEDCGGVPTDGGLGSICACGASIGTCVSSQGCSVDADCGGSLLCMSSYDSGGCGSTFGCQSTKDTCLTSADCVGDGAVTLECVLNGDHHECQPKHICATGRPFLVGGAARVARLADDATWASDLCPDLTALDPTAREELAARWTEIALMEHASIAAFARFSLELLSLGAPPSLVRDTQAAMADETVHARDAFALASAYAGRPRGPGALDVERALASSSPLELLRTAILEGCIGETVAAVEAAEALAHATDPAVRAALSRVAPDETRHAELAWRFVQWMIAEGPTALRADAARTLVHVVEEESAAVTVLPASTPDASARGALLAHGVLDTATRAELKRRVMRDVVLPCAQELARSVAGRTHVPASAIETAHAAA